MNLRKQLFYVSLLTLALPWVGCRYIQEVESTLRRGQTEALRATANAVAARIGSDQRLLTQLRQQQPPPRSHALYVHRLMRAVTVDGYNDEWLTRELSYQAIVAPNISPLARMQVVAGRDDGQLYTHIRVFDDGIHYFNPSHPLGENHDHLLLTLRDRAQTVRTLVIYASAPGQITTRMIPPGTTTDNNGYRRAKAEYRVQGHWVEWQNGFDVELKMPFDWLTDGFGITHVNGRATPPLRNFADRLPPPIHLLEPLSNELAIFSRDGVRLNVANSDGRRIARAGELANSAGAALAQQHGLLLWFYRLALGPKPLPALDDVEHTGQFDTPEIAEALGQNTAQGWYRSGETRVVRIAVPIIAETSGEVLGLVVADQSADSLATLTNAAFNRLIVYSSLITLLVALGFILYATWLSARIRRLSRAAAHAISDSGKIADEFPVLRGRDELGDLSRSYSHLLARLREYTNYLRTLSSKLSHELRTPLAIVKSSLDNLDHEHLPRRPGFTPIAPKRGQAGCRTFSTP